MQATFVLLLHLILGLTTSVSAQASQYQQCGGIGWSVHPGHFNTIRVLMVICAIGLARLAVLAAGHALSSMTVSLIILQLDKIR